MNEHDCEEECNKPTVEEIVEMRKATPADAQPVDELILSKCMAQWRKVAMVVGSSLNEYDEKFSHLPYVYMPVRMLELEKAGKLEIQGDVFVMRASEIRLPSIVKQRGLRMNLHIICFQPKGSLQPTVFGYV